jgi:hypothetical protein
MKKSSLEAIQPKTTKHFTRLIERKKNTKIEEDKPLYKLKMFKNVESRVRDDLKKFKTFTGKDNLDHLIDKVENELKAIDNNN